MIFDKEVVSKKGSVRQARGFRTLRHSLFLTCVQDIAKYTTDADKRTPSIRNIVEALEDSTLLAELKERYALWRLPPPEEETDPAIIEALRRMEMREQAERRVQFDKHYRELGVSWAKLSSMETLEGFRTIRDKLTAHTEIRFVADKYQPIDIGELGIKWGDLKTVMSEMQVCVELIGLIVRNAGFAWEMLDEQLTEASRGFWSDAAS